MVLPGERRAVAPSAFVVDNLQGYDVHITELFITNSTCVNRKFPLVRNCKGREETPRTCPLNPLFGEKGTIPESCPVGSLLAILVPLGIE